MMSRKIKYSKIAIVIFLTVLIWVWADLATDETLPVPGATITITGSNPNLWVSFDGKASASIDNVLLKGPASKIAEIKRELNEDLLKLNFNLRPEWQWQGIITAGSHTINVLDFIQESAEMRELSGLTAESCEPNTLTVNVAKLVQRPLTVQCVDEVGNIQKYESIEPPTVNALAPSDWTVDKLVAQVKLTRSEIEQARTKPIERKPYVELSEEQIREAASTVIIKLPPEEDPLKVQRIEDVTISIAISPTLLEKYYPVITNLTTLLSNSIVVRATDDAKKTYEYQRLPHMTLYIFEDDIKQDQEIQRKAVYYNFPEEFVRKDQIDLVGEPAEAEFTLKTLPSVESK